MPPEADLVVTEGNYLLLDRPEWRAVREQLDEVVHLVTDDDVRRRRLVARHVEFGKTPAEAEAWAGSTTRTPLSSRRGHRADRVVDAERRRMLRPDCPCGSDAVRRCGVLHRGERQATPEELMRSRYSAYALGDLGYVDRTWHPRTRPDASPRARAAMEASRSRGPRRRRGVHREYDGPSGPGAAQVSRFERRATLVVRRR